MSTPSPIAVSRRRFIQTAVAGGLTTLASASLWKTAAAMVGGPKGRLVYGAGLEDPGLVQLSINENPLGPSPHAVEAAAKKLFALNRYPAREPVLHEAIARHHGVTADMVANGVGSSEILNAITLTAIVNGGGVVEPEPGYGAISGMAEDIGRPVVRVKLTKDLQIDLDVVRKAITSDTKIVSITNPNNPTGQLLPADALRKFIDSVPENIIVCVDEAYLDFVDDEQYPSVIPLTKTKRNLFVTKTMSKAYGLGGMRIGYGIGHPSLIERVKPFYLGWLGRTIIGDAAAIAAFDDDEHVQRVRTHVRTEKEYLYTELARLGLKPVKTQTIFVIADVGRDTKPLVDQLEARKILIRRAFGMPNFIRVSVGTHRENEVFLEVLKEVLNAKTGA
ncbi:MAG: aminotransferase class I/II-fold pyridoxal phosphate-dependent enzyme [Candidatus Latescibacteria bacterium]|nr:aminotransferase class I/II-fold pyridoxal phosphate-dependent enzyme [Candidatus Latescibacterota bacterium]